MIDYHCHILPGIDDGPTSVSVSLLMAEQLLSAGFIEVYCTPHCIRGVYENTPATVRQAVLQLQESLDWYRIPLKLWPGMEYCLDEFFVDFLADLQPLGATRMVLVEAPPHTGLELIVHGVNELKSRGYIPLVAHPERFNAFGPATEWWGLSRLLGKFAHRNAKPEISEPIPYLQEIGCRFQGNLGSLVGYYGPEVKARAMQMLEAGQYDFFGSDGHALEAMEGYLEPGLAVVRGALGSWPVAPESSVRSFGQMAVAPASHDLLVLYGPSGAGKTALLGLIEAALEQEESLRADAETVVWDIPFSAEEVEAFEAKYLKVENLLVDDLQTLVRTPGMAKEFCRLVRARQEAGRLTVVASALSPEEWTAQNGLLAEMLAGGADIRLHGRRETDG